MNEKLNGIELTVRWAKRGQYHKWYGVLERERACRWLDLGSDLKWWMKFREKDPECLQMNVNKLCSDDIMQNLGVEGSLSPLKERQRWWVRTQSPTSVLPHNRHPLISDAGQLVVCTKYLPYKVIGGFYLAGCRESSDGSVLWAKTLTCCSFLASY